MGGCQNRREESRMHGNKTALRIHVTGIVQGVGFRPFVYNLARSLNLTGWVKNTSAGVDIFVEGLPDQVNIFSSQVRHSPPPLARIDTFQETTQSLDGYTNFEILSSLPSQGDFIPISPDIAICPDCRRELFDPPDRRYRYPFINCTNCGPRLTIIRDIPYDRPTTTMADFPLCDPCHTEYENPADRRFHAQPIACPTCGPHIWFSLPSGQRIADAETALQIARQWLAEGKIIAIKGLGGFHLACDATNPQAVAALRSRKKRSDKPFALMAFDVEAVQRHCHVTVKEQQLLLSHQQPIVLLDRLPTSAVAAEVAPNLTTLGVMLAYTPLHLLLLEPAPGFPDLLVMTSGNLSEEPVAYKDDEAAQRLTPLADAFLLHDRPIHTRVDDSVVMAVDDRSYITRRSRGYAPDSVPLPITSQPILATGAELKNTFCLTRDRYAFLSHHIGDLENLETLRSFEEGISHFEKLFRISPRSIACDLHPNYLSTRYALDRSQRENLPLIQIQHHYAHLAACLADNGWNTTEAAIGLIFDGTGFGTDSAIWGGEILVGGYTGYTRNYHLANVPLPGGDLAVRKPSRMALAYLWAAGLEWEPDLPPVRDLCYEERMVIRAQLERRLNAPPTSSMGRLFDAAASLIGVRHTATYEGQAAIELEALADPSETGVYPFDWDGNQFDPAPLWTALLTDWRRGTKLPVLSARFHNSVASIAVSLCGAIRKDTSINSVCLSGGVWQNRFLLRRTTHLLTNEGFIVLSHKSVPTNDGGIALGQAVIAAYASA